MESHAKVMMCYRITSQTTWRPHVGIRADPPVENDPLSGNSLVGPHVGIRVQKWSRGHRWKIILCNSDRGLGMKTKETS